MKLAVELVSTGAELLSGRTLNTHALTLAEHLAGLGLPLVRDTTVPDDLAVIRDAVRDALARAPIVVVSGGLGPTSDDLTRDAVAQVVGAEIVMHEPSREAIRARYAHANRVWSELAARHALVLSSAEVLDNRVGLAPGEAIQWSGRHLFLLPGPPNEFEAILADHVIPRLRALTGELPLQRLFQLTGIGESDLIRLLPEADYVVPGLSVGYCARTGRVELRVTAEPAAASALERAAAVIRARLGEFIFAERRVDLAQVVVEALAARGRTVAVAESCTGGLLGQRLTSIPGSSRVFPGGVIAYANEVKARELGVPPDVLAAKGAVSPEVARAMAVGVRARFGADYGIGVTGIAGPDGGTAEKPVGLVYVGMASAGGVDVKEFRFGGPRAIVREMSAQTALDLLRRALAGWGSL
jgi:nicotinamide-nucleotide amidase